MQMRAAVLLLVAGLAVASAQTANYSSLAAAVAAANSSAPNLSILLAAVQVSHRIQLTSNVSIAFVPRFATLHCPNGLRCCRSTTKLS
jgi:hypothetical protein